MMRVLVATDTWHPQINGVVHTLTAVRRAARSLGVILEFLTPEAFPQIALPNYPEIKLGLPRSDEIPKLIANIQPNAIHIATEGPIGLAVRAHCLKEGMPFTTSFHTRFPDYLKAYLRFPRRWTWAWLRKFHAPAMSVLAATPGLVAELSMRGFSNVELWPRGVDEGLFRPRPGLDLGLTRPVFLSVGRISVEKNLPAFLSLGLPGTKVVVGNGPERDRLSREFPDAVFLGTVTGEALAMIYSAADVFVFPSRTDTFGLVLLEALASGVPIAAFPVRGPSDVIGDAPVGVLDEDLGEACMGALRLSRQMCRSFALRQSWHESAKAFSNVLVRASAQAKNFVEAANARLDQKQHSPRSAAGTGTGFRL